MEIMSDPHKEYGFHGEHSALIYLKMHGYSILDMNYRVHGLGEVDIIALQEQTLIAIEVKRWHYFNFEQLEFVIDKQKIVRMGQLLEVFLQEKVEYSNYATRFDVIFIDGKSSKLRHIKEISL